MANLTEIASPFMSGVTDGFWFFWNSYTIGAVVGVACLLGCIAVAVLLLLLVFTQGGR